MSSLPAEYVCHIMGHDKIVVTHERKPGQPLPKKVAMPYIACGRCGRRFPEDDHFFWDETAVQEAP